MRVQRTAKLVDNRPHFATICGNFALLMLLQLLLMSLLLLLLSHLPNSLAGNLAPLHMIKSTPPPRPQLVSHATPPKSGHPPPPPLLPRPLSSPFHFQLPTGQFNAFSASFCLFFKLFLVWFSFFLFLVMVLFLVWLWFLFFWFGIFFAIFIYYCALQGKTFAACNLQLHFLPLTQT